MRIPLDPDGRELPLLTGWTLADCTCGVRRGVCRAHEHPLITFLGADGRMHVVATGAQR